MKLAVLAGTVALAFSSAASAAIVTTTFSGTVTEGTDTVGLIGTAGADLTGLSFSAVFTVDTSINRTSGVDIVGPFDQVISNGVTTPFLSAVLTVDGNALTMPALPSAFAFVRPGLQFSYGNFFSNPSYLFNVLGPTVPGSLDTPYSLSGPSIGSGDYAVNGTVDVDFYAIFNVESVEAVIATAGVPEPATWALMILGFGTAGAMLRRRRLVPN